MSETVTITKEHLRAVLVAAWTDCIPAAHLDFNRAWELLVNHQSIPDPERSWDNWFEDADDVR